MAGIDAVFDSVGYDKPKFSRFDGSHDIKTTCQVGKVFPLDCIPVYPKDHFTTKYNLQAKFDALVAPIFQRMNLKQWSFLVRNADLWDDFQEFVSGVNPRLGRTAYPNSSDKPVHPFIKLDKRNQFGSSYLGVKLNLSGIDLSKIKVNYEDNHVTFDIANSVLYNALSQIMSSPETAYSWRYEDGSNMRSLFNLYWDNDNLTFRNIYLRFSTGGAGSGFSGDTRCALYPYEPGANIAVGLPAYDSTRNLDNGFGFSVMKGFKPLFSANSICDYLGYPCSDMRSYVNSDRFVDDLASVFTADENISVPGRAEYFINEYICGLTSRTYINSSRTPNFVSRLRTLTDVNELKSQARSIQLNCFTGVDIDFLSDFLRVSSSDGSFLRVPRLTDVYSGSNAGNVDLCGVVIMYLLWCKFSGNTTTTVDDCPYFDHCMMDTLCNCSNKEVDSLRIRAYHKIWNDYYRHPNLTAEIPIPYSDGGDDVYNYYTAVHGYLNLSESTDDDGYLCLYDWTGRNLASPNDNLVFPLLNLSPNIYNNVSLIWRNYYISLASWNLLTDTFHHLRKRDYITGCMPNTSVVDIVAPVMPTEALQAYENTPGASDGVMTNNNIRHIHETGYEFKDNDKTKINPTEVRSGSLDSSSIGWLDLENLRITQKLVNYFKTLRYAMGSFKDFVKSFFDADISDLTIHRAKFLGGHSDNVSVSELVSSAEYENNPQGSLAGRAFSYGESSVIDIDINDYGFFITLECLSPIESNVGGLDRQLIRDTEFDYFNPKFAELGDMMVSNKEVTAMPTFMSLPLKYDSVFGYTQRYMDLKFIPNRVHGDFLGSLSDWHLDLIQPAIGSNKVKLSQNWLEERSDDRVFAEIYDDTSVCKIWCECQCSYVRALPSVIYDVIA